MTKMKRTFPILMADDDEDDRILMRVALSENGIDHPIYFVHNGEDLLKFLYRQAPYDAVPKPYLIFLDLNMPLKDGREALREIKSSPALRTIPVIVLTTSEDAQDIAMVYELGANSCFTKPNTFQALVDMIRVIVLYWSEVVEYVDHDYDRHA